MTIKDYIWLLLPSSMKRSEEHDSKKYSNALGNTLDTVLSTMFLIREQAFVRLANAEGLRRLAADEDLEQLQGESIEAFRNRILSVKQSKRGFCSKKKLEQAILTLGYTGSKVDECYLEKYKTSPDPKRVAKWAEFDIRIPAKTFRLTTNDMERIRATVNRLKPGWTKANIIYSYLSIREVDAMTIGQLMVTKLQGFKGTIS